MAKVELYTTPLCPYCRRALALFKRRGVEVINVDLWLHPGRREEMLERSKGARTVPQVFINGRHVGGSDELAALEERGELDALLAEDAP